MPTEPATSVQQLIEERLKGSLYEFVLERRKRDPQLSWRRIARDIFQATDVDVSDQTLANWYPELRPRVIDERQAS